LQELKDLFGSKPTDQTPSNKETPNARAEAFAYLQHTYTLLRQGLQTTTLPVNVQGSGKNRRYDVTINDLKKIDKNMPAGHHLRLKRGKNKAFLYSKPDFSPQKNKRRNSKSHGKSRWYHSFGALHFTNTRRVKFINAKQAVRDALAAHFDDNEQLANELLKRVVAHSTNGLSELELRGVLNLADTKTRIEKDLQSLYKRNCLQEINKMSADKLLQIWMNSEAQNLNAQDLTARTMSNYDMIYQSRVRPEAIACKQLATGLREFAQSKKLTRTRFENIQTAAEEVLFRYGKGLSSRARADLKQLIDLKYPNSGIHNPKLIGRLYLELDRHAQEITQKTLVDCRNHPLVTGIIREKGLDKFLSQQDWTNQELDALSPETLSSQPNSNVEMAFRLYCQANGINESHQVQLAQFWDHLDCYLAEKNYLTPQSKSEKDKDELRLQLKADAKSLLDQGVRWQGDDKKRATYLRMLNQLANGQDVWSQGLQDLQGGIGRSLSQHFGDFRNHVRSKYITPKETPPRKNQVESNLTNNENGGPNVNEPTTLATEPNPGNIVVLKPQNKLPIKEADISNDEEEYIRNAEEYIRNAEEYISNDEDSAHNNANIIDKDPNKSKPQVPVKNSKVVVGDPVKQTDIIKENKDNNDNIVNENPNKSKPQVPAENSKVVVDDPVKQTDIIKDNKDNNDNIINEKSIFDFFKLKEPEISNVKEANISDDEETNISNAEEATISDVEETNISNAKEATISDDEDINISNAEEADTFKPTDIVKKNSKPSYTP
ncbi:MAG: hypothetical protein MI861_21590, partial [Pirellulales bacterium]|nr:hypothetical protein [Pirellulales bacterium]